MAVKSFSLKYLAEFLDCEWVGEATYEVSAIETLELAQGNHLTFLAQDKFAKHLPACRAGVLVVKAAQSDTFEGNKLLVDDPYMAYAKLSRIFERRNVIRPGIHPSAVVADSAVIDPSVGIGPNAVIGEHVKIGAGTEISAGCVVGDGSQLGDRCLLHANVTIYAGVFLGNDVKVHGGTVLGSDGFGFAPTQKGWVKIHQLGGVRIGNRVEIGSNTSIDRGALTDTVIEDGVIIDNLVHIAHGVRIGEGSAIAGCVGIAGSTTIGKNCQIAGAVAINGHIDIADNTYFHGGTIVTKGITESGAYASIPPVQEVRKWRRNSVRYTQLDDMAARLKALEKAASTR
ncbi:UDP-3-O-(3-hydroxymyristoyl)glucosamine N-acyltransferase [Teredinibacter purpureus]|uniref:UDP-3-O-(3-hydroxymyristoyl)glucosamine N-acyltransferase n=1 Tax=Teredinibacter purpureus TaxID=2731756 RepID=UPI0005F81C48|nr:UDP-3-O-(3-hydroxymyristoyl)glucosamine N-acyltransferase [Teredinibacter purpureus]